MTEIDRVALLSKAAWVAAADKRASDTQDADAVASRTRARLREPSEDDITLPVFAEAKPPLPPNAPPNAPPPPATGERVILQPKTRTQKACARSASSQSLELISLRKDRCDSFAKIIEVCDLLCGVSL